jgi:hypothetical protein
MSSTKHFLQRQRQRNGSLDMRYRKVEYFPNPAYSNQEYQVEFCPNGTRVIPINAKTKTKITVMTNVNGSSIDGVSINLRDYYYYPDSYDENPDVPPAPAPESNN